LLHDHISRSINLKLTDEQAETLERRLREIIWSDRLLSVAPDQDAASDSIRSGPLSHPRLRYRLPGITSRRARVHIGDGVSAASACFALEKLSEIIESATEFP
jgi:hypothetical protein